MLTPSIGDLLPAETHSPEETQRLGAELAMGVKAGDVIAIYGNLGAGKTQFIKGLCEGLGVEPTAVHSPTFTLVNEYDSPSGPVFHFDAYRIERLVEFIDIGYEEYFFGGGRSLVEWADRIEPLLPDDAIRIRIEHAGENRRRIVRVTDSGPTDA